MTDFIDKYLFNAPIGKIVAVLLGIITIWSLFKLAKTKVANNIKDTDSRYRAKKALDIASYLLMILVLANVFSDKLSSFTVALGVAGAGIAFALQEVIASVAGWLAIMFGGFYKTGDRVALGGIKGDVIDIGVLRTTLMEIGQWVDGDLYNGRIVLIANSFVFKEPVFNYSRDFPFIWDEIKIPIQFGSNYTLATTIFEKIASETVEDHTATARIHWKHMVSKFMIEDAQTEPMITLTLNDNWVEFTIRYVVTFKKRRSVKNIIFRKILEAVEATGSEVKFASATFQLVETPTIRVVTDGDIPPSGAAHDHAVP